MNKAEQFVDNFEKGVSIVYDNVNKSDMSVCIFIYARDKTARKENSDGEIRTSFMSKMDRFDGQNIKNILNAEIDKLSMGI